MKVEHRTNWRINKTIRQEIKNRCEERKRFKKYIDGCDSLYAAFCHSFDSISSDGGVYAYDGMWVYPDGTIEDDES